MSKENKKHNQGSSVYWRWFITVSADLESYISEVASDMLPKDPFSIILPWIEEETNISL